MKPEPLARWVDVAALGLPLGRFTVPLFRPLVTSPEMTTVAGHAEHVRETQATVRLKGESELRRLSVAEATGRRVVRLTHILPSLVPRVDPEELQTALEVCLAGLVEAHWLAPGESQRQLLPPRQARGDYPGIHVEIWEGP